MSYNTGIFSKKWKKKVILKTVVLASTDIDLFIPSDFKTVKKFILNLKSSSF